MASQCFQTVIAPSVTPVIDWFSLPLVFVSLFCIVFFFYIFSQFESQSSYAQALEPQLSSEERKQKWEQGQADYMGMDSFDNIKRKLDSFLK